MEKKELLAKAKVVPALLQVGKNGLSPSFLDELSLLVKKKGLVKVRFLKSFSGSAHTKIAAAEAAEKASLHVLQVTGNTAVFVSPNKQ